MRRRPSTPRSTGRCRWSPAAGWWGSLPTATCCARSSRSCTRRGTPPRRESVLAAREDADVETSSEAYARRFAGPVGEFFLEVQAAATLDLLRPWPGSSLLEVGGGHGQLTGPPVEAGGDGTAYRRGPPGRGVPGSPRRSPPGGRAAR